MWKFWVDLDLDCSSHLESSFISNSEITINYIIIRGFMAARKHKEQILILVKMMYSTQGANLPCFKAGILKS